MPATRQPLFLARASYRKRRLRDGARILPIFGFVLLIMPLLWPQGAQGIMGHWGYVFVLWLGLIGLAAVLSRGLAEPESGDDDDAVLPDAPAQKGTISNQNHAQDNR